MQPFDYTINAIDPFLAGMAGMEQGQARTAEWQRQTGEAQRQTEFGAEAERNETRFGWEGQLFDQGQQDRQAAMAAAEHQRAAAMQMQQDQAALAAKVADGTATDKDFTAFSLKYPELASELKATFDDLSVERRQADAFELGKAAAALKAGRPDVAIQMLEDRAQAAENSGDAEQAGMARAIIAQIKLDPAIGLTIAGLAMEQLDEGMFKRVFGTDDGATNVQSSTTLDDGTSIMIFEDGSKRVTDAAGNTLSGQAAADAIKKGHEYTAEIRKGNAAGATEGRMDTEIEKGGEVKAEEEMAKGNIESVNLARERLATISSTITNYDNALAALDAGANTGAIAAKLPTLTAATVLLENAQARLGFDVIASVTFGALTEGERAAAMAAALPVNLPPEELRQWIMDRKSAEMKIAEIQKEAILHFTQPGRSQRQLQAEWVEKYSATAPGLGGNSNSPLPDDDPDFLKYGAP